MEFREFINAWTGYIEAKRQDYAVLFEVVRFGSFYNTFSKDQGKALGKAKNPYTDHKVESKPVTMGQISGLLSAMASRN
jgi:hypothetical protein